MVNEKGSRTSVIVPIKKWEKLNDDYQKLQDKVKIFTGLTNAINEVYEVKRRGKKLQTLKDFLNEGIS